MSLFLNIFAPYIQLIRIHNWVKNILIFLPILSSHNFSYGYLQNTIFIFFVFSISASSMYIINDYFDYNKDLLNKAKKKRPIASGKISKNTALIFFLILQLIVITISILNDQSILLIYLFAYNLIVLFYTLVIKNLKYLDVTTLASLFLYRVFLGAEFNNLDLSIWIINFVFFLFLGLGFLKRFSELNSVYVDKKNFYMIRPYGDQDKEKLSWIIILCFSISTILLINYFALEKLSILYEHKTFLYLIPPLFFIYCLLLYEKMISSQFVEDPINFCIKQKSSWIFLTISFVIFFLSM